MLGSCAKLRGDYLCLGELGYTSPHDGKEELTVMKKKTSSCDKSFINKEVASNGT